MPQNHVQTYAQNHGRVRPLENKDQFFFFFRGAAPDPDKGGYRPPYRIPGQPLEKRNLGLIF